tara:strand:+ start:386 stop:559 length:174 start_codon:yes stop_codon:yes gene_type:complete
MTGTAGRLKRLMTLSVIPLKAAKARDIIHNRIIVTWIQHLWNFASAPTFFFIASATG